MDEIVSLSGPVELLDGELVLLIPLDSGGAVLSKAAKGISEIDGDFLKVKIPQWLATKLTIGVGTIVSINNVEGKFNILPQADDNVP